MKGLVALDVVTDADLLALDVAAATDFGDSPLAEKRHLAVHSWLQPRLEQAGFAPARHRTRRTLAAAYGVLSANSVTGDVAADLNDRSTDTDVTPWLSDTAALYVRGDQPWRGLVWDVRDAVNSAATGVASVTYWAGAWTALPHFHNGTAVAGVSWRRGGRMTWSLPDDWLERTWGADTTHGFWLRVQASAAVTNLRVAALWGLSTSRLTDPAARYALGLLYQEGVGGNRGRWQEKADKLFEQAKASLDVALTLVADEFDADDSGAVAPAEVSSVVPTSQLYRWQRG